MGRRIELSGQKFGKLTVVGESSLRRRHGCVMWECVCDCGETTVVSSAHLISGHTVSCGCFGRQQRVKSRVKHGECESRLYKLYQNMKARCYNPDHPNYPHYGGRGIKVCDEWLSSYEAFRDWALCNGYEDVERGKCTLDRHENNKEYSPANCRWVSQFVQANNTTRNHFLTYGGKQMTIAQWAREVGLAYPTLYNRIRSGWTVERALTIIPGR